MRPARSDIIRFEGDLDSRKADFAHLLTQFAGSTRADADVDLSQVTRFNPAALSFLVALRRICASRSGVVTLVNPSAVVRRALSHGLEPYFRIQDDANAQPGTPVGPSAASTDPPPRCDDLAPGSRPKRSGCIEASAIEKS
jgi:anti-anti-sigma factor